MPWVKLDDQFPDHAKIAALSSDAFRAHVMAICYSARMLTDGFVPRNTAWMFAGKARVVQELVPHLWELAPGGYRVHDYLDYNPTRAQVMADRELAKRRLVMNNDPALAKAVRRRDGDLCRYCGLMVSWNDRKGVTGGTYDHVLPLTQGGLETAENIVVCCRRCNSKKGARTPEQAGITLHPPGFHVDSTQISAVNQDIPDPRSPFPDPDPSPDPENPEPSGVFKHGNPNGTGSSKSAKTASASELADRVRRLGG